MIFNNLAIKKKKILFEIFGVFILILSGFGIFNGNVSEVKAVCSMGCDTNGGCTFDPGNGISAMSVCIIGGIAEQDFGFINIWENECSSPGTSNSCGRDYCYNQGAADGTICRVLTNKGGACDAAGNYNEKFGKWDVGGTQCVECNLISHKAVAIIGDTANLNYFNIPAANQFFLTICGAESACNALKEGQACVGGTCDATGQCVPAACADADGDTYTDIACGGNDCNDTPGLIGFTTHPGATDICGNDIDEDCFNGDLLCNTWLCDPGAGGTVNCSTSFFANCAGLTGDSCAGGGTWNCPGGCNPNCNQNFGKICASITPVNCGTEYASCNCACVLPAGCTPPSCNASGQYCKADGTWGNCVAGCVGGACVAVGIPLYVFANTTTLDPSVPELVQFTVSNSGAFADLSNMSKRVGGAIVTLSGGASSTCTTNNNGVTDPLFGTCSINITAVSTVTATVSKTGYNNDQLIITITGGSPGPGVEICTGGADEDGDTLFDCADPDCAADAACVGASCAGSGMFVSPLGPGYCTIGEILEKATNWILALVSSIIILVIIIGGIMYISSAGDEEKLRTSKNMIFYAIVGLAIILVSYALITEVTGLLGG